MRENEDKRKTEDHKHLPWKKEEEKEKLLFGRNNGGLRSGQKPTCVCFNSEEQKSLHCNKYWIVSSKTENKTKECKVLELHKCETKGITVQITRLQKL